MTVVNFTLTRSDLPASGRLSFAPLGGDAEPFSETVGESGLKSVVLTPTPLGTAWRVTINIDEGRAWSEYVLVPDALSVDYDSLQRVDPDTLGAVTPGPDPAWYSHVDTLAAQAEIAATNARESRDAAVAAQDAAVESQDSAATSATIAQEAADNAGTEAFNAGNSAAVALGHRNDAQAAATVAMDSATDAETAATAAEQSETSAFSSATSAATSAGAAQTARLAAESAAVDAVGASDAVLPARDQVLAARTEAVNARNEAVSAAAGVSNLGQETQVNADAAEANAILAQQALGTIRATAVAMAIAL